MKIYWIGVILTLTLQRVISASLKIYLKKVFKITKGEKEQTKITRINTAKNVKKIPSFGGTMIPNVTQSQKQKNRIEIKSTRNINMWANTILFLL